MCVCVSAEENHVGRPDRDTSTVPDGLQAHQQDLPAPTGILS